MPPEVIVAAAVFVESHVPPLMLAVRPLVAPSHTDSDPEMVGSGFTVTTVVAMQPVGSM